MIERENVVWGAKNGTIIGVTYAGFAGVVIALRGGLPADARFAWPVFLAMYPVWGFIGGAIVGALRPLLRTRPGAIIVVGLEHWCRGRRLCCIYRDNK